MKKAFQLTVVMALLFLNIFLNFFPSVKSSVIRVPQDVPTIQLAINIAYPGDTILVSVGTYSEHIVVNKSVTITGENPETTIIDGGGIGYTVFIKADNVVISGFTIQNGDRGIYVRHSKSVTIDGNTLSNNLVGIYVSGGSSNIQIINNNVISNDDYGIRFYNSTNNLISGNIISYNYIGLSFSTCTKNCVVSQNTIIYNTYGIRMYNASDNTIDNNVISYNKYGIYASSNSNQNTFTNNEVSANTYGIRIWHSTNNILRSNAFLNNQFSLWIYGNMLCHYIHDVDSSNTVNGKPVYYWVNKTNLQIPLDAGYVAIINSSLIAIRNLHLSNNYHGILLAYSKNCLIENVTLSYNVYGIKLYRSNATTITSANASFNSDFGIRIYRSHNNILTYNYVSNNSRYGIYLYRSKNCSLSNNVMENNGYNFGVDGDLISEFIHDVDSSNTVNGKPVYYWVNKKNLQAPLDAGYIAAVNCTNIVVKDLALSNNEHGVLFAFTNNSLIENVHASFNQIGIEVFHSKNDIIRENEAFSNIWYGIYLYSSTNNTLINNSIYNNTYNFGVYGTTLNQYLHNIDQTNLVNNKPVYYWINVENQEAPLNAGYFAAINSTRIRVIGLNLTHNYQGILFAYTSESEILNVNLTKNRFGIYLDYSNNIIVRSSVIFKSGYRGIYLYNSNNNIIKENIISFNKVGIKIHWQSRGNHIFRNDVSNNDLGIWIDSSSGNKIYLNNFIYNLEPAMQDLTSTNQWDNGIKRGNYWSDYAGVDLDRDGVGDTMLPHLGLDYYPLMFPVPAYPLYDINADGKVDITDVAVVAWSFGSFFGHPKWNPVADLDNNGKVDITDVAIVAANFGKQLF